MRRPFDVCSGRRPRLVARPVCGERARSREGRQRFRVHLRWLAACAAAATDQKEESNDDRRSFRMVVHQQSESRRQPEYIFGHACQTVAVLA